MKKFPDTRDLLIVAAGIVAVGLHICTFHRFYCDDALISLRYAQRLLAGHGLTWTDGPRVEGYSNLLWILACSALGRFGIDLITASRVLGALGIAAVFGALLYQRASRRTESLLPFAAGVAVIGLAAPPAAWALAGLETPWVAAFLAWGFVLLLRSTGETDARARCTAAGACLGLLGLTRPDGPLFAAVGALWLALSPGVPGRRRRLVAFSFWPLALLAGQLAFRLVYYGEWLPNVWYVKISPSLRHFVSGAGYVARGLLALLPASLAVPWGLAVVARRDPSRRASAALLLAAMAAWLLYVSFIGGDIFLGRRHLVPFVVMLALGMMVWLEWLVAHRRVRRLVVVVALAWFVAGQIADSSNRKLRQDLWVWNTEVVGRAFHDGFGAANPLLAVTAAGGIPYWSQLPCIDMLGLNDRTIARSVPPDRDHWIGHEHANADYVLSRRPDLIHFGTAGGGEPTHLYGEQLAAIPAFARDYTLCRIGGWQPFEFVTNVYVDRESPRIGITRTRDGIRIPSYFIQGDGAAMWDPEQQCFVVTLRPHRPVGVRALVLEPGRWEVMVPPGTEAQIVDAKTHAVLSAPFAGTQVVRFDEFATVDIHLRTAREANVAVHGLNLVRR